MGTQPLMILYGFIELKSKFNKSRLITNSISPYKEKERSHEIARHLASFLVTFMSPYMVK